VVGVPHGETERGVRVSRLGGVGDSRLDAETEGVVFGDLDGLGIFVSLLLSSFTLLSSFSSSLSLPVCLILSLFCACKGFHSTLAYQCVEM
jgi:hypothetical protein